MRFKHFKNANVDVSKLAVGTWAIGGLKYGDVNEKDSIAAIRAMLDGGVNLIDTAPSYGLGVSEQVVAKAIKGLDREKFMLATKFGVGQVTLKYFKDPAGYMGRDARFENCLYQCEASLRQLGTDYIDFYFVHWPDVATPIEETMTALNYLKEKGYIKYIGVSNFSKEQIQEAQKYARIDAVQPPYSMVNEREKPLMQWCESEGIGSFTYGSLGSGILTGAVRQLPDWPEDDIRLTFYDFYKEPKFSKCMELLSVMDKISEETGKPLAQIAINWSTQKDYVGTALCGVRNTAEAIENCATFDWKLTDEQMKMLDDKLLELNIETRAQQSLNGPGAQPK